MDDMMQKDGPELFQEKRYAEAAEAFRRLLARQLSAGMEADTRRRLADALDILGRSMEASEERARAATAAEGTPDDSQALMVLGDLRKREGHSDEACDAYSKALGLMPLVAPLWCLEPEATKEHALVMAKLALAHHAAGRPGETVRWAEASLEAGPEPRIKLSMLRMAGIGLVDGGDLERAGDYYRQALAWAETLDQPSDIAQQLVLLAGFERKRGRFEEAIAACRRAAQVAPASNGLTVEAESLCDMGRFEEARAVIRQSCDTPASDKPWVGRRMRAIRALGLAWLEAAADDPEAAQSALDEARAGFGAEGPATEDKRLILWCDATDAHVRAKRGRDDEARRLMEAVRAQLPDYDTDQTTLKTAYAQTGRAALFLGDLDESLRLWRAYLDCCPFPYALPTAQLHLGETLWCLGETDAAREAFRQAVAPGIDSLDARRAQARLDELGG